MRIHLTPYLPRLLTTLLNLIANGNDVDILEIIFQTMAHIFKLLEKQLLVDFINVFKNYTFFLEHKKDYVREFAAESFAFLIRKLPIEKLSSHINVIFQELKQKR